MFIFLIAIYTLLFLVLAWRNYKFAVGLFIVSLPSYLIRFNLGPLPTTLLELNFGIVFLVWLVKFARSDWPNIKYLISNNRFLFSCFFVFLLSSVAGIFVSDMWYYSLGQWRAYFLEPMLLFVVLVGRLAASPYQGEADAAKSSVGWGLPSSADSAKDGNLPRSAVMAERPSLERRGGELATNNLLWPLLFSGAIVAAVAIIQASTGALYPPSLWNDALNGRATSFFTSPNAVGLFLGPIFFIGIYLWRSAKIKPERLMALGLTGHIILGLVASQSLGALIAVAVGLLIYLNFYKACPTSVSSKKKILSALFGIVVAFILVASPYTRNLISSKTKSFDNRLTLWGHTITFLTQSPKNFIFGAGIRQYFRKVEKPFYNPVELERLIYPHNIFINFWSEIGLFGMLAFVSLFGYLSLSAYRLVLTSRLLGASLLALLTVILIHGLVDVPYFKNDLAFLFWIIAAIVIASPTVAEVESRDASEANPTVSKTE